MGEKKDAITIVEKTPSKEVAAPQITDVVEGIKNVVSQYKATEDASSTYDFLRYRSGDNGLICFIYGDKGGIDEDKVIKRLEQVIQKYKDKKKAKLDKRLSKGDFMLKLFGK